MTHQRSDNTPLLDVRDLEVARGEHTVVHGLSMRVTAGEVVGLLGPNGAGKSTLLSALTGLLPLAAGRVVLNNRELGAWSSQALARVRSYLPQGADVQWPLTVENVVALGRIPHGDRDGAAISAALEETDTQALAARPINSLSGGQRARVLLARALAVEAELLLVDEPIAGLDPHFQLQMMHLLVAQARRGAGVLLVLHDLALAARFCDRLVLMKDGAVVASGPPAEVLTLATVQAVFDVDALIEFDREVPIVVPK